MTINLYHCAAFDIVMHPSKITKCERYIKPRNTIRNLECFIPVFLFMIITIFRLSMNATLKYFRYSNTALGNVMYTNTASKGEQVI